MKKEFQKAIICLGVLIIVSLFISNASAITGKIGNGKMFINLEEGDSIDRSILVINDNNISVNISLFASGDLEKNIQIVDKEFILKPGEEKKAGFKITAGKEGKYEEKVNVKFTPIGLNESGVGLSSQITLNVYKKGNLPNNTNQTGNSIFNSITSKPGTLLIFSTLVLVIAVIVLMYLAKKKKSKNGGEAEKLKSNGAKK